MRASILRLVAAMMSNASLEAAVTPPHIGAQTFDALPKPLPLPYDEAADAQAAVARARAQA